MYFKPNLRIVFKNNRYLRCVFHSIVVKMSALEKKFDGGPDRFLTKNKAICNRDLAVVNAMGTHDLWPIVEDLDKSGFIPDEDATMFDATSLGNVEPETALNPYPSYYRMAFASSILSPHASYSMPYG